MCCFNQILKRLLILLEFKLCSHLLLHYISERCFVILSSCASNVKTHFFVKNDASVPQYMRLFAYP